MDTDYSIIELYNIANDKRKEALLWKERAHYFFDLIWKHRKYITRKNAYRALQFGLNIKPYQSHMGHMGEDLCKQTIKWSIDILNSAMKLENDYGISLYTLIPYPEYLITKIK